MKKQNKNTSCKTAILGIDPGSSVVGYGVIVTNEKNTQPEPAGFGYIDLRKYSTQQDKLVQLKKDLEKLIKKYKPGSMAIENIYFFKNAKTVSNVLQAKGVILLVANLAKIKIYEYTPLTVKQTISGYGKASKNLVQKLVKSSLGIKFDIKPDDASDALAIALCHLRHLTLV